METHVVNYMHIKLGSLIATLSLLLEKKVWEKNLMNSSMTLVFLNISPLMASNFKLGKIRSLTIICIGIGLIIMSLHRANPMKILLKVP